MAIDDNTSYELTGAQVKDLASKVNGKQDALTAGSNITINNGTISATDTTYSAFTGATSGTAGAAGLVPAPAAGDDTKYLKGDGTWETPAIPTVNDATLTIQKNSTDVATFTANASSNVTANITVPTSFSDLSGTIGTSQINDLAVTGDKIYPLTIGATKIANSTITSGKIDWTTTSISLTKVASAVNALGYQYQQRFGNLVILTLNFSTNATINSGTKLFSGIPAPTVRIPFVGVGGNGTAYSFNVRTDGYVYNDSALASGVWYTALLVYFAA